MCPSRSIAYSGPDREWLTAEDLMEYLGLPMSTIKRLMSGPGLLAGKTRTAGRKPLWHWEVALWVNAGLKLGLLGSDWLRESSEGD